MVRMDKAEKKHDEGLENIVRRLMSSKNDYVIFRNYKFHLGNRVLESDVIAFHRDYVLIFKTTNKKKHRQKALKQLSEARKRWLGHYDNHHIKTFYVYERGVYKWVW